MGRKRALDFWIEKRDGSRAGLIVFGSTRKDAGVTPEELSRSVALSRTSQSVSQIVVGRQELGYLHSLQKLSLQMALTIVFSPKESFYKSAYTTVGHIQFFSGPSNRVRYTKAPINSDSA